MRNWIQRLQIRGFMMGVLVMALLSGTIMVTANPARRTSNIDVAHGHIKATSKNLFQSLP